MGHFGTGREVKLGIRGLHGASGTGFLVASADEMNCIM